MRTRALVVLAWFVPLAVVATVLGFAACGGDGGDGKPTATMTAESTLTAEEAKKLAAIPDLENRDESMAELVSQKDLSPDDVQREVDGDPRLADLVAYAKGQGYGTVTGGVETEYTNGVVVTAGALQSPDNTLVALVRSSQPSEGCFLARLERADPLKLVVFDQNGEAALDLVTREVSFSDAHGGCRYFHCVAAAIFFLMDDPLYGRIVGRACGSCLGGLVVSPPTLPVSCPVCIATALAPVLASVSVCSEDACGWCYDNSCGGDEVVDRICATDPVSFNPAILERYNHYHCDNPHKSSSQCNSEVLLTRVEECPLGCTDTVCATSTPPPSSTCDPATCEQEVSIGDPVCVFRPDDNQYVVAQDFQQYSCKPMAGGIYGCQSEEITRVIEVCPGGCASDRKSCALAGGVPAAPSDFLALQHAGGTEFQWIDNSLNEDGFRIYFGGRSVGRPSQLITTVGPDTQTVDSDFVRSGTEVCWELYAFNAAGESEPVWYCLPP